MSKEDIPGDQLEDGRAQNPAPPKNSLSFVCKLECKRKYSPALLGFHASKNSSKVLHLEHKAGFLSYKDCHASPHSLSKKRCEKGVPRPMHWSPALHTHPTSTPTSPHVLYRSDLCVINQCALNTFTCTALNSSGSLLITQLVPSPIGHSFSLSIFSFLQAR